MFAQIWSTLTRKPVSAPSVFSAQLEPIVKYRLAMYLTAHALPTETRGAASGTFVHRLATPTGK